jgi:hypothetical protein
MCADRSAPFLLPANRYGKIEEGQHFGPHVLHAEIADDGRGNGGVACLANADKSSQREEPSVRLLTNTFIFSTSEGWTAPWDGVAPYRVLTWAGEVKLSLCLNNFLFIYLNCKWVFLPGGSNLQ